MSTILTGEQLLNDKEEVMAKLLDPFFPKVGVVALAGSSDTGKSTILQQLAFSLTAGEETFLDFPIYPTHKSVLFVSTEDDPSAIRVRLHKHNANKYSPTQMAGLRFMFEYRNLYDELDVELNRQKADCVIIDAFADVFGSGDMNQVGSVRACINQFKSLSEKHQCLVIVLHHTSKRTDLSMPSKDDLVGSQGFEAKMRTVLYLRKDSNNAELRHLCVVKGNYLSTQEKANSYVLYFDKNQTFRNTGKRVPMTSLGQRIQLNEAKVWRSRAIELKTQGKSSRAISDQLKSEGFDNCAKTVVAEELKKEPPTQQSKPITFASKEAEETLIKFLNEGEEFFGEDD